MSEDMVGVIKECIGEGRKVTFLYTLDAAIDKVNYAWDKFVQSILSVIKEVLIDHANNQK